MLRLPHRTPPRRAHRPRGPGTNFIRAPNSDAWTRLGRGVDPTCPSWPELSPSGSVRSPQIALPAETKVKSETSQSQDGTSLILSHRGILNLGLDSHWAKRFYSRIGILPAASIVFAGLVMIPPPQKTIVDAWMEPGNPDPSSCSGPGAPRKRESHRERGKERGREICT